MTDLTVDPQVMIVFPNQGYFVPAKDSALMKQLMQLNLNAPAPKIVEPAPVKRVEFAEPVKAAEPVKVVKPLDLSKVVEPAEPVKAVEPVKPLALSKAVEPAPAPAKSLAATKEHIKQQLAQADATLDKIAATPAAPKNFAAVIAAAPKNPVVETKSAPPKVSVPSSNGKCQICYKHAPFQPHLKYCRGCFTNLPMCYQGCGYKTDHPSGLCSYCYQASLEEEQYDDEPLNDSVKCTRCEMNWTNYPSGVCSECYFAMNKTCENKKNKCENLTQGHKFCKSCWEGIVNQTQGNHSNHILFQSCFLTLLFSFL